MTQKEVLDEWMNCYRERALAVGGCKRGAPTVAFKKEILKDYKGPSPSPPNWAHVPQSEAKLFLPPHGYLWRSRTVDAWNARYSTYPVRSAKDTAHGGEGESLKEALRGAWSWFLSHHGLDESHCHIVGLFA